MPPIKWFWLIALAGMSCNLLTGGLPMATSLPTNTAVPIPATEPLPPTTSAPELAAVTQIELLADGSTRVTDTEMGYAITLPAGWLVLDGSDPDVDYLVEGTFEDFPELQASLGSFFEQGSLEIRMAALDATDVEAVEAEDAFLTLGISQDELFTFLGLSTFLPLYQQSLPDMFPSAQLLSTELVPNAAGVELAIVDLSLPLVDQFGQPVELYQKQVFFKTSVGFGVLNFSVSAQQRPQYESLFDAITDTLVLLD